jgi:biotin transport system substrate-specific component
MDSGSFVDRYGGARDSFFKRLYGLDFVYKLMLSILFACLTGLSAMVRFYPPWSPVPVTAQTFVVLMCGVVLGRRFGVVSQIIYAGAGLVGLAVLGGSWFAGDLLFTGGYVLGFIVSSLLLGHVVEKHPRSRDFLPMLGFMLLANFVIIYGLGVLQLAAVLGTLDITELLTIGVMPYIPGDIIKVLLAASAAHVILPKHAGEEA